MRYSRLMLMLSLAVLFMTSLFGSVAMAAFEQPPGTPPFGAAVSSDAPGIKLMGFFSAELTNYTALTQCATGLRVAMNLSKGTNPPKVFFAVVSGSFCDGSPTVIQTAILNALQGNILTWINSLSSQTVSTLVLKSIDTAATDVFLLQDTTRSRVATADIVLAAQ